MAFNATNMASFIPNILNNPFLKQNLTTIIIIIIVALIGFKILTKPSVISVLKRGA